MAVLLTVGVRTSKSDKVDTRRPSPHDLLDGERWISHIGLEARRVLTFDKDDLDAFIVSSRSFLNLLNVLSTTIGVDMMCR